MIRVQESALLQLLPHSLRQDPVLVAIAEAAEIQLKAAYREAEDIFNLIEIDKVPERLLDLLAFEKHVDFYDVKWPITLKRSVIKASISHHRKKGTPSAVESVVGKVFGDGKIDEWFNYGGEPYRFRVITEQSLATDVDIKNLTTMISEFKNVRSWLENITVDRKLELGLNIGGAVSEYQITNILAPKFEMQDLHTTICYGALVAKYDITNISLFPFVMEESTELKTYTGAAIAKYNQTQIDLPPFTPADTQISKTYGGAFSSYIKTTIKTEEVI